MLNSFKLALKSIWSNRLRSFLTMLGIIIGVAAVIILVGIVNGEMSYMTESFASMGTNRITVNITNLRSRSVDVDEMYDFFEEKSQYFSYMSPTVTVGATVKVGNENSTTTKTTGVSEDYLTILDEKLLSGRFIQYADIAARQKVAVIGYYIATTYYGSADAAIGQKISVNGEKYEIVGVIERQTSASDELSAGGSDDTLYIPYTAAVKLSRNGSVGSYTFCVRDDYVDQATTIKTYIEDYLYTIFKDEDLYTVTAMSELLDSMNEMIGTMSMMLGGIASISLLVAGVGVMNIMLVSVAERTREIGIRKAIGARRADIMSQFLIEACTLSILGGLIGLGVSALGLRAFGLIANLNVRLEWSAAVGALLFCVLIGVIFGSYPASKASRMTPIDALQRR